MQATEDIDPAQCHVAFSHMHADHCLDFPSLLVWRRFHPHAPSQRVHDFIGREWPSSIFPERPVTIQINPMTFRILSPFRTTKLETLISTPQAGLQNIGGLKIYAAEAVHTTESYLLRVQDGRGASLVYTGDTAYTENLVNLAAGADVLLCEATWCDREFGMPQGMHMCGQDAGKVAEQAGVGKLILTHIPPWGDSGSAVAAAKRHFTGRRGGLPRHARAVGKLTRVIVAAGTYAGKHD